MINKIYLHPLPLRMWHWANALIIAILIITGVQLRIPGVASLNPHDSALVIHKYAGWSMVVSCIFWLAYSLMSGNLKRQYVTKILDFKGLLIQAKYYLYSIFKGGQNPFRPSPDNKFNPLQKLAYSAIMLFFAPLVVCTGLFVSDILFIRKYVLLWNLAGVLNALHVIGAYVFTVFLVIHIYMATLGPTAFSHIKSMIVGFDEEPDLLIHEGGTQVINAPDVTTESGS
ncbi:MAG TPA: cytochrome b/b6 domain-containing protein [Nitrospirota bacterium]|nr:cytochrome b/b6 domain-containing protein [Nitrospirota bacterium]